MERMMKVQEVILKAMAGSLKWWEAAEIIGVSDRTMRRWRERYQEHGYDGLYDRRKGPETSSAEDGREGAAALPGEVFRFQRAPFSREADRGAQHRDQLHVGEDGTARSGTGEPAAAARNTSASSSPASAARNAAAHRCQQTRLVSGWPSLGPNHHSG